MKASIPSIPVADDLDRFISEPLEFLAAARTKYGNLFAIGNGGPLFSRCSDCSGVVVACGIDHQRAVLSDIETFTLPISAAENMSLSKRLVNLNRSLHSMRGNEHSIQKRALSAILNGGKLDEHRASVWAGLKGVTLQWTSMRSGLLDRMRELTLEIASRVLFETEPCELAELPGLLRTYFELRREASSRSDMSSQETLQSLVSAGNDLDTALRRRVRECRRSSGTPFGGTISALSKARTAAGFQFSEDEIVGHMNVLFISSTEPIAVALTWILLILTQSPKLRVELRREIEGVSTDDIYPTTGQLGKMYLLEQVIHESMRLLPPNAFMVRITSKPTWLNGVPLPAHCEVLLCPFLSQRDEAIFERPLEFLPKRWDALAPSPYVYFPFGAGGHSCVGRSLAMDLIKTSLAFLIPRFSVLLSEDQAIDWRVQIMFKPDPDPTVVFLRQHAPGAPNPGRLGGPLAKLIDLRAVSS